MPTPAGKPKVGEYIVDRDGSLMGEVIERSTGDGYSVKVHHAGQSRWITEFAWWKENKGWKILTQAQYDNRKPKIVRVPKVGEDVNDMYVLAQIDQLPVTASQPYLMKIATSDTNSATKWMSITPAQLRLIRTIFQNTPPF